MWNKEETKIKKLIVLKYTNNFADWWSGKKFSRGTGNGNDAEWGIENKEMQWTMENGNYIF